MTLAGAAAAGSPAVTAPKPARIVSLNLCTDQILIELVGRGRIRAVSHLAADPLVSAVHERATGIPVTHGGAEEVVALGADLVLAGTWSTPATVALLRRTGRRVVSVPLAQDIAGIRGSVRTVAAAVGEEVRGEAMIADFDRRLAAVAGDRGAARASRALVYDINGLTAGPGTLPDAALAAAGYANMAAEVRLGAGGRLALEQLVAKPPDLLVLPHLGGEYRTAVADNLVHPALARVRERGRTLHVPARLWLCGTTHFAEAVERLAAARATLPSGLRAP